MPEITRLSPDMCVSPQLRPEDLAGLAAAGFRGIVNTRPDGEEPGQPPSAALEAEAKRLGLAYRHIPIAPGAPPTERDAAAFRAACAAAGGPVLGFCRSGARASKLHAFAGEAVGGG